jgi:hypothetical protein
MEVRLASEALTALIVNLHLLRANAGPARPTTLTVVVDAGAVARHLRRLAAMGVLPPVDIRAIARASDAKAVSDELRHQAPHQAVIARSCFARYHAVFGPVDPEGHVRVV